MILQLPLSGKKHVTIISAYAPAGTYSDEVKDKLYNDLNCVISIMLHSHKLILLGGFSARVYTDYQTWEGVTGTKSIDKCNRNGLLLFIFFEKKNTHKKTFDFSCD